MKRSVITGTGRAGTSILLRFLGLIGIDVGDSTGWNSKARAGLEYIINPSATEIDRKIDGAPKVFKDPRLSFRLRKCIEKGLDVEFVLIPVRDMKQSALSRTVNNLPYSPHKELKGGDLQIPDKVKNQLIFNQRALAELIETVTLYDIPYRTIAFPRFIEDPNYLYEKLKNTPFEVERAVFDRGFKVFNRRMISSYSADKE